MINFVVVITSLFLFIFIPGWFFLSKAKYTSGRIETAGLSVCVGIASFIFCTFILRLMGLPFWIMYVYVIAIFLLFLKSKPKLKRGSLNRSIWFHVFAIGSWILTAFFLISFHSSTGFSDRGFVFSAGRDNLWRVSIMQELTIHFPPHIPGYAGVILENYHFLYDLLIAGFNRLTGVSIFYLHFQLFSFVSAVLFCVMAYVSIRLFVKQKWIAFIGGVFTVWAGNLSYLLPFISSKYRFFAKANIFMSDAPFDQGHNPFNFLAYSLFLASLILMANWITSRGRFQLILLSVILAVLPGIKIYAGIIAFAGIIVVFFYETLKKRASWLFVLPFVGALPVLSTISGGRFSILAWNPFWLLTKMIEDQDRLFLPDMALKIQHYRATGNWFRLIELYSKILLIYFIGNLNIRVVGVFLFFRKRWFSLQTTQVWIWIGITTIVSFLIPLFFSQTRAPYDSIQFTQYGLLLMSLTSWVVIDQFTKRFHNNVLKSLLFIGILCSLVPTNVMIAYEHVITNKQAIASTEVDALKFLYSHSSPDDVILTDLSAEKLTLLYISAISGRRTYLSGISLTEQLGIDTKQRRLIAEEFFSDRQPAGEDMVAYHRTLLAKEGIDFVYISKEGLSYDDLLENLGLNLLYANEDVRIYKVK